MWAPLKLSDRTLGQRLEIATFVPPFGAKGVPGLRGATPPGHFGFRPQKRARKPSWRAYRNEKCSIKKQWKEENFLPAKKSRATSNGHIPAGKPHPSRKSKKKFWQKTPFPIVKPRFWARFRFVGRIRAPQTPRHAFPKDTKC